MRIGPGVRWREGGHELSSDEELLRFHVADRDMLIKKAAADADLYQQVLQAAGRDPSHEVLALSAYATSGPFSPAEIADKVPGREVLTVPYGRLRDAGVPVWPTTPSIDGVADPLAQVHFDIVVATGPGIVPEQLRSGTKAQRREARERIAPWFDTVLRLFDGPFPPETLRER